MEYYLLLIGLCVVGFLIGCAIGNCVAKKHFKKPVDYQMPYKIKW